MCGALAGVECLDFERCGWGDDEACRLSLVLPLCARLERLNLASNHIGDAGACALAGALSLADGDNLGSLRSLALDANGVGDAGAAALFGVPGPELRQLTLANNAIGDEALRELKAALDDGSGSLRAASKIALDGNPASAKSRKEVAKALKARAAAGKAKK